MKYFFPHYFQLEQTDCGPTCLKIISKYYGKPVNIQYLKNICSLNKDGTTLDSIAKAAEIVGLRSKVFEITLEQFFNKSILPCIVVFDDKHYVVVYKMKAKQVWISDPAKGKKKYSQSDFSERFIVNNTMAGKVVFLEPQPSFYNTDTDGYEKEVTISYLRIIIKYLTQYKAQLLQLFIVMLLITVLQGIIPFIFRAVLDVGVGKKDIDFVYIMLAANITMVACIAFASSLKDLIIKHVGSRLSMSMISNYLVKLLDMPLSYFSTKEKGDILNRIRDHDRVKDFILNNLLNLVYSILTFFVFGLILLSFNLMLFIILIIGVCIYVLWTISFMKIQEGLDWNYNAVNNQDQSYWVEFLDNITDIKVNNYEQKRRWKWENIQIALYHLNMRSLNIKNIQVLGSQIINNLKNIFLTFFCALAVINGEMSIGEMISVQIIIGFLNTPIQQFISFIQTYTSAKTGFLRLNELHKTPGIIETTSQFGFDIPKSETINIQNVYFRYPGNNFASIKNISLSIPRGGLTAIIGKSGSGKSSLMKLLLRLYEPNDGIITVGDLPFKELSVRKWRSNCAAVLQDSDSFNGSILNNIVLDDYDIDYKRVATVVDIVGLNEILKELPKGYNTIIGEKGRTLSQGQKQRILIARALYRQPEFLFLDEATNGLDAHSEKFILENIINYMKNKTVVISTHKLETIKHANHIVVFDRGFILEQGTEEVLMQRKGMYYSLTSKQSL